MAEFRQDYIGSFSQNDTGVGIGTSSPSDGKLEIVGGTTAQELDVTGISTFTHVSGFVKKHTDYTDNIDFDAGDSGTLSGEIVVGVGLTMTVGTSVTTSQGSVDSLKVYNMFQPPSGTTNTRPAGKPGALFYNFDFKTIEFFDGNSWRQVDNTTRRGRCVWAGGYNKSGSPSSNTKRIDFVNSHTLGNSRNFGDLSAAGQDAHGSGNAERGLFGGRFNSDAIEYITIASEGNSIDFGNSSQARYYTACASSSTRSLTLGGYPSSSAVNTIDYVQIMTLGDALDFGDLSMNRLTDGSAFSNGIEAFVCGGYPATAETYDIVKISSTGNGIAGHGTRSGNQWPGAGCSNSTRGIWAGGANGSNVYTQEISYITMASKGNAQHFGDLSRAVQGGAGGGSNATRGIIAWGRDGFSPYPDLNTLEFITFSTQGNAQDFGDLRGANPTAHTRHISPVSDSHGGLGGF